MTERGEQEGWAGLILRYIPCFLYYSIFLCDVNTALLLLLIIPKKKVVWDQNIGGDPKEINEKVEIFQTFALLL